jgi:hypothetical protein
MNFNVNKNASMRQKSVNQIERVNPKCAIIAIMPQDVTFNILK